MEALTPAPQRIAELMQPDLPAPDRNPAAVYLARLAPSSRAEQPCRPPAAGINSARLQEAAPTEDASERNVVEMFCRHASPYGGSAVSPFGEGRRACATRF